MLRYSWGALVLGLVGCSASVDEPYYGSAQPPSGSAGTTGFVDEFPVGGEGGGFAAQPPLPGAVFTAAHSPPPVSGGTLLVTKDQKTAIVADPDRDQVLVVDLASMAVTRTLALAAGSEPGRAADDADGHVHLVLRGSGKLLTFDPQTGDVLGTRSVCSYPRGLAVMDSEKVVHVACAEGSLVTLSTTATDETPVRKLTLDRDLRDVVVGTDGLWVSRFRSAEILRLDSAGKLVGRTMLPGSEGPLGGHVAEVAWRMIPGAGGGVVVVHQRAFVGEVAPSPGGYSGGISGGLVEPAISTVDDHGVVLGTSVALAAPLPVDVAQSSVSGELLIASAALEHPAQPSSQGRTLLLRPGDLAFAAAPSLGATGGVQPDPELAGTVQRGQLVAVAFAGDTPLMQYREPSSLVFGGRILSLPGASVTDTGDQLFHLETSSGLACASCHPEGREDGHVWNFMKFGLRRTQSLRGGLLGTEPFHWDGAESDFTALTGDVMQGRMGGPELEAEQATALAKYVDGFSAMPAPALAQQDSSAERGKALFNDANVACASCHSGSKFTNNLTVDVGTPEGNLQVPSLIGLWSRAPYLHDGCAQTIVERFGGCDTGKHGNLQGLSKDDIAALSAYLETL